MLHQKENHCKKSSSKNVNTNLLKMKSQEA